MDSRRLQLLAAVAEHGSITRAAAATGFSQPSLSRQIASLEREVGFRLLVRSPGGVQPTAAGHALVHRGEAISAHVAAAEREAERVRGLTGGQLRIAAFPSAAATLALDAVLALRERHPELSVTVEERDGADALDQLRRGRADLAITFAMRPQPSDVLLDTTLLLEEEMLLALPAGDPRARAPAIGLVNLREDPWILGMPRGDIGLIATACAEAGFEPRVSARLDNQPAIQAAVASGVGVTLIPALAAADLRPGVVVRRLRGRPPVRRVLGHALAGPRDPAVAAGLLALQHSASSRGAARRS
jgi:molybdate transport repressor ModE-like protein